jgi:hypothetical protein
MSCFHCDRSDNLKRCRCQGRDQMLCPDHLELTRRSSRALNREFWRIFGRNPTKAHIKRVLAKSAATNPTP